MGVIMILFSKEWVEALAEKLKHNDLYQKKAEGFDSYFQIIAKPNPEKGVTETKACGLLLPQATESWIGIRQNIDYTMTASYEIFYKIVKGHLGPILAITTRKAIINGNFPKMMKYTAGTNLMIDIMKKVPVQFEGNFF